MSKLKQLFLLKSKFLISSVVATGFEFVLFLLLVYSFGLSVLQAQVIAYPLAVLLKYFLEKWFIFESRRKGIQTFGWAMMVSGIGFVLSLILVYFLNQVPFLHAHPALLKIIEKGILFFYNFYFKRFAFERRFM